MSFPSLDLGLGLRTESGPGDGSKHRAKVGDRPMCFVLPSMLLPLPRREHPQVAASSSAK